MSTLSKEQEKAIENINGPVRIIAGPGSGKTRTIVHKMKYLIENNYTTPERILAITFTNKASNEMSERVGSLTNDSNTPKIMTYHSFCALFLRIEGENIDLGRDYEILDMSDQKRILKKLQKRHKNLSETLSFGEILEKFKSYKYDIEKFRRDTEAMQGAMYEAAMLYVDYKQYKKSINALDFDDLIIKVSEVLSNFPEIADHWKNKYDYIFVDEFQDTDVYQYKILRSITTPESNLTIVGDPDQNIYSWRGSDVNIFMNFDEDYKGVVDIFLSTNYRSTQKIVESSKTLIQNNSKRFKIPLNTINEAGKQITVYEGADENAEASWIGMKIKELIDSGINPEEIAIIYRLNSQSAPIEFSLSKFGVNYKLIGGMRFFERKVVKEVMNFIKFFIKRDNYSLAQVINTPTRGMGPKSIQKIEEESNNKNQTMYEFLTSHDITQVKLRKFIHETQKAISRLEDPTKAAIVVKDYLKEIGFLELYSETPEKLDEVNEILKQLEDFLIGREEDIWELLIEFIQRASLHSSADVSSEMGSVTMLTGHSSKGLEFDHVFILGMNEGVLPHFMNDNVEEERRLFYVMMTRARKELYLSYSLFRSYSGHEMYPSRFINESKLRVTSYNKVSIEEGVSFEEIPEGYENSTESRAGDMVFHTEFGSGVVMSVEDGIATVAFDKKIGVKTLLLGHKALFIKV